MRKHSHVVIPIMANKLRSISLHVLACLILGLSAIPAKSQIYTSEIDPGWVKWNYVTTPSFKIIYPVGMDSLARVYGNALERYRLPEGWSSGMVPGEGYRSRTPVLLHPYTATSIQRNGHMGPEEGGTVHSRRPL